MFELMRIVQIFSRFLDPIYFGDYPKSMRDAIGDRLPPFSHEEIKMLQGSLDFIGLNHYTTRYITPVVPSSQSTPLHLKGWPEDSNTTRLSETLCFNLYCYR